MMCSCSVIEAALIEESSNGKPFFSEATFSNVSKAQSIVNIPKIYYNNYSEKNRE